MKKSRYFVFFFFVLIYLSCKNSHSDNKELNNQKELKRDTFVYKKTEIRTYLNDSTKDKSSGWGYDIYLEEKRYIHQPHIPAIGGNKGFTTKEEAEKTAELIVYKIQHNILPPSISAEELDSLGIEK